MYGEGNAGRGALYVIIIIIIISSNAKGSVARVLWIPYESIDKENFIASDDDVYGEYNV